MFNSAHAQVLRLINQSGPLSRTELVGLSGISKATISALTFELIDRGVLTEGEVVYGAGRPSVRLALNASSAVFMGVSLAADGVVVVAANLQGQIIGRREIAADPRPEEIVAAVVTAVTGLIDDGALDRERILGAGVSVPGLVDVDAGLCVRSTVMGWRNVPIGSLIAAATGLETFIENDANALALGQHLFGPLKGATSCSVVSVGEGIGCGHILNGEVFRGHRGGAGEIAHATIELDGLPCKCGKRGCLDTLASLRGIQNLAREASLTTDLAELDDLADQGNLEAVRVLHRAGAALGLVVSQLFQMLDPERVIVALTHGSADGLFARALRQTLEANVMPNAANRVALTLTTIDSGAWALGAASIAADCLLFAPRTDKRRLACA